jgi:hypothetical protein
MNPIVTVTGFWDAFVTKIAVFLPNLFFAAAIIVLGWAVCNIIKRIVVRLLKLCQFDLLAERAGINRMLERGGIKQSASDIVGLLVFWFLFLIAIVTTLETLNLSGATDTLHTIYLYIPKIVAALVTLILVFRKFSRNRDAHLVCQCRPGAGRSNRSGRVHRHHDFCRCRHLRDSRHRIRDRYLGIHFGLRRGLFGARLGVWLGRPRRRRTASRKVAGAKEKRVVS